jgi:hypothetical protein
MGEQVPHSTDEHLTAGVCAFSLTSRITQRDGTTGRDASGSRNPATRDCAGRFNRDVHGRPAACLPCVMTLDQPTARETAPVRQARRTGAASAPQQSRKTLSAA